MELDIVNINITKLEEEQLRLIEKCTNVKIKEADLNECITNDYVVMPKNIMNLTIAVKLLKVVTPLRITSYLSIKILYGNMRTYRNTEKSRNKNEN